MSKLIFSSRSEAMAAAGCNQLVYPVSMGWQVVTITKCPDFVPPRVPLPVADRHIERRPQPKAPETVCITLPLLDQSEAYVAVQHGEAKVWVKRSVCFSHAITGNSVTIEVSPEYAAKRGF